MSIKQKNFRNSTDYTIILFSNIFRFERGDICWRKEHKQQTNLTLIPLLECIAESRWKNVNIHTHVCVRSDVVSNVLFCSVVKQQIILAQINSHFFSVKCVVSSNRYIPQHRWRTAVKRTLKLTKKRWSKMSYRYLPNAYTHRIEPTNSFWSFAYSKVSRIERERKKTHGFLHLHSVATRRERDWERKRRQKKKQTEKQNTARS